MPVRPCGIPLGGAGAVPPYFRGGYPLLYECRGFHFMGIVAL
jgi:hypothetical protein